MTSGGVELGENNSFVSVGRIGGLVDGIFAIAMTLMVLDLKLPVPEGIWTNSMVWSLLGNLTVNLFVYALSFFILAVFWLGHHKTFDQLKRADQGLFFLVAIWLFFVALMPFSTNLVGGYGSKIPAALFFNANFFLLGIFSFLIHRYIINHDLSEKIIDKDEIRRTYRPNLIFLLIAALGLILSVIIPVYSYLVYLMAIVALFRPKGQKHD